MDRALWPELGLPDLMRMLQPGGWCWPHAAEFGLRTQIRSRCGLSGSLAPTPGRYPLLTVEKNSASLWLLDVEPKHATRTGRPLGWQGARSWDLAACAVPRSVPAVCHPIGRLPAPHPRLLVSMPLDPSLPVSPPTVLDGGSFGLAFALALASWALELELPEDSVSSAAIDEYGRLYPVDALDRKLAVVARYGLGIRRVLVADAEEQEQMAREAFASCGRPVEILRVPSLEQALDILLAEEGKPGSQRVAEQLVPPGAAPSRQAELVEDLFNLALGERKEMLDWSPVRKTAMLALERWRDALDPGSARRLEFVSAVAARHDINQGVMVLPDPVLLEELPLQRRLEVACHVVQSSADTGQPAAADAEAMARSLLPEREETGLEEHLKLRGALGRLLAVEAHARDALVLQRQAAMGWVRHGRRGLAQLSYPLSEWFRLAGALQDPEAFQAAEDLLVQVEQRGGLDPVGQPYVDLARARSLVELGRWPEAREPLQLLFEGPLLTDGLRLGAARQLVRCHDLACAPDHASAVLDWVQQLRTQPRLADKVNFVLAMVELDRAIRASDTGSTLRILAELLQRDPGLSARILDRVGGSDPIERGVRFLRSYPY